MKISWNTLTLVLHRYAILSLVELKFYVENLEGFHGELHGNCTGNFAGAARGLVAARMLFLPAGVHWKAAGRIPCRLECCRMKFLRCRS